MENRTMLEDVRVLFVAQEELFYSRAFFEKLLDLFPPESIAGVVLCPVLGKQSRNQTVREMYRFCGPADFARLAWRYVRKRIKGKGLEEYLLARGVPVYHTADVAGEGFASLCRRTGPDAIMSVSMPGIFGENVRRLPRLGCFSIQHSPLPGSWDITENFWRMYHGRKNTEITVYRMNGEREAEVIFSDEVDIWIDESLDNLLRRMFRLGAGHVLKVIERVRNDAMAPIFTFDRELPAFGLPGRAAAKEFRRRGKRLF